MSDVCGKHRGVVVANMDLQSMGRIQVIVDGVMDGPEWAMPCVPYAGPGVGFLALPPVGARVWVEFEAGDVSRPIWVGGFWEASGDAPTEAATNPDIGVIQCGSAAISFDRQAGSEKALLLRLADGTRLKLGSLGIEIRNAQGASVRLIGPSVDINEGGLTVV